jgi:glycosyltransferase involved in cell wall biosynthesis
MCACLAAAGYDTFLVAPGESFEENGVRVLGAGDAPASRVLRMTRFARKVYRMALSLDAHIYHLHDPELLRFGLKLMRGGKRVIYDSHEFPALGIRTKGWIPGPLRPLIAWAYKTYEARVCKKLDGVIAVCDVDGKNYFKGRAKRVWYIANYPGLQELGCARMDACPKDRAGARQAAYIGGLSAARGITAAVQSAALAGVPLHIAGAFASEAYKKELESLPAWANVTYHGVLDRRAVQALLRHVSIGVSIIKNEGQYGHIDTLPVKVYEYMAYGLPVVLSDTPFHRKLNEALRFGVCVDPDDEAAVAGALRFLCENPAAARALGKNGRAAVLEKFNWETEKKTLLAIYQLLGG